MPLGAAALEILAELKAERDRHEEPKDGKEPGEPSAFVLPAARGNGHFVGVQKAWEAIRTAAGLPGVRLHDARHSFASVAVAGGATLYVTGKLLGHRQARTTEGYAHLADDPLRVVADAASRKIAAAMKGPRGGAEVSRMQKDRPR